MTRCFGFCPRQLLVLTLQWAVRAEGSLQEPWAPVPVAARTAPHSGHPRPTLPNLRPRGHTTTGIKVADGSRWLISG